MKNIVLGVRTDQPTAELYLLAGDKKLDKEIWPAGHELSKTILQKILELLKRNNQELRGIRGVVVFDGPGSFTGLRIGVVLANTLAYSLGVSVVGSGGPDWLNKGVKKLVSAKPGEFVAAKYGREPNITKPKP